MSSAINAIVGDRVITTFSGRKTTHRIVDRRIGPSQTGVMFLVDPVVPKSGGGWIDSAWFRLVDAEQGEIK